MNYYIAMVNELREGIKVGLFLSTRITRQIQSSEPAELLALCRTAEAVGFDSLWVGDSLLARPRHEPLALLGAIAASTKKMTLGTGVLLPALRHPLLLAHSAATVDRISAGRLVLGFGAGFNYPPTAHELESVGVPFRQRVGRMVETIEVLRKLWSVEQPIDFEGRYWRFANVELLPRPLRHGGPPIWMGGNAGNSLIRAGEIADGWFATSASPDKFKIGWEQVQAAAIRANRKVERIETATLATINVNSDERVAAADLRRYMETYYSMPYERLTELLGCRGGSGAACADWLGGFRRAGVRHLILRLGADDQFAQLERVAADVLPRLRTS